MYTLHDKHVEKHTMEIWCFMALCFHLIVYKQQDFSQFIVKLCSKLTNYGKSTGSTSS
jgi:hypothetical protein